MKINRLFILAWMLVSFLIVNQSYGQAGHQHFEKIAATALQDDLRTLKDSLIAFHPGMYRYANADLINQVFDSAINAQTKPADILHCYATVRYLLSALKDGHTKTSLPGSVFDKLKHEAKMFPAMLHFSTGKAYLPCGAAGLPAGTQILAINKKPIDEIKNKLFQYIRSDGNIITKKYWDVNFGDSPFPYLYYLVYGEKKNFNITYRLPSTKYRHNKIISAELNSVLCTPPALPDSPTIKANFVDKDIAVLQIAAFVNKYPGDNFRETIRIFFEEVHQKEIKKIVLDLRDNGGGQDVFGADLYSYLTSSPFPYFRSINSTQKVLTAADHPNLAVQQPKENPFTGKLYILINGQSFSTTADFCAIARSNHRATFIGVETGGGYYGNTSGADMELTLPHSRIKVKIPMHQYFNEVMPALHPDRGILPDHEVRQDIRDYIKGIDTQYNFAIKLAQSE